VLLECQLKVLLLEDEIPKFGRSKNKGSEQKKEDCLFSKLKAILFVTM
jgi:hypothetical protein